LIFPDHRGSPEPAGDEDGREYRLACQMAESAARQEQERIRVSNAEKMARLRARLDTGQWQQADPVARAVLGRSRDLLDEVIDQVDSDPLTARERGEDLARHKMGLPPKIRTGSAALDWLAAHRTYNAGPS
jgi:hypothetical protein